MSDRLLVLLLILPRGGDDDTLASAAEERPGLNLRTPAEVCVGAGPSSTPRSLPSPAPVRFPAELQEACLQERGGTLLGTERLGLGACRNLRSESVRTW